jgi:hypothetical protein
LAEEEIEDEIRNFGLPRYLNPIIRRAIKPCGAWASGVHPGYYGNVLSTNLFVRGLGGRFRSNAQILESYFLMKLHIEKRERSVRNHITLP